MKRHASNLEIIEVLDSSDNEAKPMLPKFSNPKLVSLHTDQSFATLPSPVKIELEHFDEQFAKMARCKLARDCDGRVIIMQKSRDDAIVCLDRLPNRLPVPKVDMADIVDQ